MLKLFTRRQKLLSLTLTTLIMLLFQYHVHAQTKTVGGKVTDSKGEGLPGVSVLRKGENTGTTTDAEGRFKLQLNPGTKTLVFTYIGFETREVNVTSAAEINVVLKETSSQLSEVVVVGYGTQKKSTLTGSVSQINGKELGEAPAMNVTNLLAGRLPGLATLQQSGRPGYDNSSLRIRGISTTSGSSAPVTIVDGVEREFANLDPNEIESISILKDASAAATYGARGANGVILVTTKRGAIKKPTISYKGEASLTSFTRFPKFLNGPDYMDWYRKGEVMDNEYLTHNGSDPVPYTYSDEEIAALRDGTNTNPFFGNTDWMEELLGKDSYAQHHNISLNGGTEKVRYFTSIGLLNQDGVVKNNDFKRYNLRSNVDAKVTEAFSVSFDLGARKENRNSSGIPADNGSYMNPFFQAVRMLPNLPRYTQDGIATASRAGAGVVSPLEAVDKSGFQDYETGVLQSGLTLKLDVPQVKGLQLKMLTTYDRNYQQAKTWVQPYNLAYRDRGSGGWVWVNSQPTGITTNTLRQSSAVNNRITWQPSINYDHTFGDHNLKALAVYEYSQYDENSFSTGARNFALTDLKEIDYGSKASTDFISPTGNSGQTKRSGAIGRLNYDFKNKYLIELVGRYDVSMNFFGSDKKGDFYPAASIGWVVSDEPFFEGLKDKIDFLKFRGSAGKLGNDVLPSGSSFPYLQTFSLTTTPTMVVGGNAVSALYTNSLPNPTLSWETMTAYNAGLNASLWGGLFGIEFDWFYKLTKDIINTQTGLFPSSIGGYQYAAVNYGMVANRGFELELTHHKKINEFDYSVKGTLNWARNKILRINEASNVPALQRLVGKSVGTKFGFVSEGLFRNWEEVDSWATSPSGGAAPGFIKYKDLNGDGQIKQNDDFTAIGRSNTPELVYGLNLNLKYKSFDFSTLFQGAGLADIALGGGYEGSGGTSGVSDNTPFTRSFYNLGNSPYYLVEQAWTPENPDAKYPRLSANRSGAPNHNGWQNSQYIVNGAYLRLKSIQVGAALGPKMLKKLSMQQCRIYLAGFNLFTWDHVKYLDPEMPNVNNGFYPQQKMYTLGTNITF